eukprot:TRINITY_DN7784_c0_g1_i1.p1 TRINITY_DN7784_c0_g1~~TRINITY_DN7784_c0_g1_i1.p1  ORF type:complete len:168 (+),score=49.13 TRINITY_DN7784_c0_g1_i1:158-661(+)
MTPLHHSCQKGHLECVRFLCENAKFNPNDTEVGTYTSLHWAAAKGRADVARYLLTSTKCDPSLRTLYGETARDIAVRMHKDNVVQVFDEILGVGEVHLDDESKLDLHGFLKNLGLEEYEALFVEEAIDLDMLKKGLISEDDLKSLGIVKMGHRKKILFEASNKQKMK